MKAPSERQRKSRDRNWRVWKLRGLYWNSHPLQGEFLASHRLNIDAALIALGAEPETDRHARRQLEDESERRKWEMYDRFRAELLGAIKGL